MSPERPRSTALPRRPRERAGPALWLACAVQLAACVCPPTLEEWSEVGFRTPEETLRSFQLAVRADAPRVEYRALSVGMRRGLSQLAWREAREEWYRDNPFLRSGIAKAEVELSEPAGSRHHRFVVGAYGRRFEVLLVREDFYQAYADGQLVADELLPYGPGQRAFSDFAAASEPERGERFLSAGVAVPENSLPGTPISELRIGQEWKVDAFRPLDDDEPSPPSPSPQP